MLDFYVKWIADFVQFSGVGAKFLFLGDWELDYVSTQFWDFSKS